MLGLILFIPCSGQSKSKKDKVKNESFALPPGIAPGVSSLTTPAEKSYTDFPIDTSTYILGPGDVIGVDVIGEIYQGFVLNINPQGGVIFPEVGYIDAVNNTIPVFKKKLEETLLKKLRYTYINVYLIEAKSIRITITGAVEKPGNLILDLPARLSDAIEGAQLSPWGRIDSIIVKNNGKEEQLNLFNFYTTGDPLSNPILAAGSTVNIPSCQNGGNYIFLKTQSIFTVVAIPEKAKISDLPLLFPAGFGVTKARTFITVARNNHIETVDGFKPIELQTGDTISILPIDSKVYIAGIVANPGAFDYSPSLTISQYISMAGGATWNGSTSTVIVFRNGIKLKSDKNKYLLPGDIVNVPPRTLAKLAEFMGIIGGITSIIIAAKAATAF